MPRAARAKDTKTAAKGNEKTKKKVEDAQPPPEMEVEESEPKKVNGVVAVANGDVAAGEAMEGSDSEADTKATSNRGRKRQRETEEGGKDTPEAEEPGAEGAGGKKARIVVERKQPPGVSFAGSVLTLGQGDTGQLGLGEDVMERSKPGLVKEIDAKVTTVVAGGMHTLALTVEGEVYSFGCNDEGALGREIADDEEGFTPGPVKINTAKSSKSTKIVQISAGDSHSVALADDGKAYYWGTFRDSSGSFGLTPDGQMQKLPIPLAHHLDVAKIASGSDHVALLTTSGELYTLGCGEQGQLGRIGERFTARGGRRGLSILLEPDRVRSKSRRTVFTDVWAGSYDTLALTEKDEILACGLNNYSQLGTSKSMLFHTMVKSKGFSDVQSGPEGKWSQIAFGQHHTIALDEQGKVFSLGRADYGRLGLGQPAVNGGGESENSDAKVPTLVGGPLADKKCVAVSCGTCVSFAVTEDGQCYSWGMGTNGQLGHSGDEDAWTPVLMEGKQLETRKVVGVSGGGQHTVLIAADK